MKKKISELYSSGKARWLSHVLLLFLLGVTAIFAVQCGGGGGGGGGGDGGAEVDLTGSWSGTWSSSVGSYSGTLSASITHSGTSVSGTINIAGAPCIFSGEISGTASGSSTSMGVVSGQDAMNFEATYTPTSISGTYSVTSGTCAGDSGTFSLSKGEDGITPIITTLISGLSSPSNLIVKETNIIWSDASERPVKKMSLIDGSVTPLTIKMGDAVNVIVNGQYMYWIDTRNGFAPSGCVGSGVVGVLHKTFLDENINLPERDTVLAEGENCVGGTSDIVVDDTNVYWVNSTASPNTYTIEKVPIVGGESTTLVSTSPMMNIVSMVRDATHLYWLEGDFPDPGVIKKMPLGGGEASIVVDGTDLYNGFVGNIVLQDSDMFFAEVLYPYPNSGARLYKFSLADGTATIIGDLPALPKKIVADDTNVFWIDDTSVNAISIVGGSITTLTSTATPPVDIEVNAESVYWSEGSESSSSYNGSLRKVSKSGGAITVLAEGISPTGPLTLDSSYVYWVPGWISGESIQKIPLNGGVITPSVTGVNVGGTYIMTVDNTNVYVTGTKLSGLQGLSDQVTVVPQVPQGGGQVDSLAGVAFSVVDMTTDGINLYLVGKTGPTWIAKISISQGTVEYLAEMGLGMTGFIEFDNTYVYWNDYDAIYRAPINGGQTETLATVSPYLSDMVVEGTNIFLADMWFIERMAVDGGERTSLTSLNSNYSPHALAVDGSNVYWVNQWEVGKVPKAGGSVTIIAEGLDSVATSPNSIAADDASLYWTEVGGGTIKKATPK